MDEKEQRSWGWEAMAAAAMASQKRSKWARREKCGETNDQGWGGTFPPPERQSKVTPVGPRAAGGRAARAPTAAHFSAEELAFLGGGRHGGSGGVKQYDNGRN